MTKQDALATLEHADLGTIAGGAAAAPNTWECAANDANEAAAMIAKGTCTARVFTTAGKVIELPVAALGGAFLSNTATSIFGALMKK